MNRKLKFKFSVGNLEVPLMTVDSIIHNFVMSDIVIYKLSCWDFYI